MKISIIIFKVILILSIFLFGQSILHAQELDCKQALNGKYPEVYRENRVMIEPYFEYLRNHALYVVSIRQNEFVFKNKYSEDEIKRNYKLKEEMERYVINSEIGDLKESFNGAVSWSEYKVSQEGLSCSCSSEENQCVEQLASHHRKYGPAMVPLANASIFLELLAGVEWLKYGNGPSEVIRSYQSWGFFITKTERYKAVSSENLTTEIVDELIADIELAKLIFLTAELVEKVKNSGESSYADYELSNNLFLIKEYGRSMASNSGFDILINDVDDVVIEKLVRSEHLLTKALLYSSISNEKVKSKLLKSVSNRQHKSWVENIFLSGATNPKGPDVIKNFYFFSVKNKNDFDGYVKFFHVILTRLTLMMSII